MITAAVQNLVRRGDSVLSRLYLSVIRAEAGVISLLFHSLFADSREISKNLVDPLEHTTVAQFERLIEYYLGCGYRFIAPTDLLGGLDPDGKYALLTFDDGYFNNSRALPVLQKHRVPAVFFISTNHVRDNKCFWWDVLYREHLARGMSRQQAYRLGVATKRQTTEAIEARLAAEFGPAAFAPRADVDRPFTPAELKEFSQSPYVFLGNHTANHAILTNYTSTEIARQVQGAQDYLEALTGRAPQMIAYPNGAADTRVMEVCRSVGLRLGFTICPQKCQLPLSVSDSSLRAFSLGRFVPHNQSPIETQCRTFRSDWQLYRPLRGQYLRWVRKQEVV